MNRQNKKMMEVNLKSVSVMEKSSSLLDKSVTVKEVKEETKQVIEQKQIMEIDDKKEKKKKRREEGERKIKKSKVEAAKENIHGKLTNGKPAAVNDSSSNSSSDEEAEEQEDKPTVCDIDEDLRSESPELLESILSHLANEDLKHNERLSADEVCDDVIDVCEQLVVSKQTMNGVTECDDGFLPVGEIEFREEAEGAEEEHANSLVIIEPRKEPEGKSPSPRDRSESPKRRPTRARSLSSSSSSSSSSTLVEDRKLNHVDIEQPIYNNNKERVTQDAPYSLNFVEVEAESVEENESLFERNLPEVVIVEKESPKSIQQQDSPVSVRSLKAVFGSEREEETPTKLEMKDEGLDRVSLKDLKEAYVKQAARESRDKSRGIVTGVDIRQLRASWSDLTEYKERSPSPVRRKNDPSLLKIRSSSIGNISELYKESPKEPVYTGVSVRALKSSVSRSESCNIEKKRIHVKSVDPAKVARQFNKSSATDEVTKYCKSCGKQVFQMEQIKAEKGVWHKNCFRCKECSKQLTLDIYESHEGDIYCKPHFKQLFKPKAVFDEEEHIPKLRKPEMIIRESNPIELPEDVVRSSDKPDYGLEEICQVADVKSRYQVFEQATTQSNTELARSPSQPIVKRSPSILSRMSKFQNGSFGGISDEALNGTCPEQSSSSSSEGEEEPGQEKVIKSRRKKKESVPRMEKMADVRSKWEAPTEREERREELKQQRKEELLRLRQAMCMGQTNELKTQYQEAVQHSQTKTPSKERIKLEGEAKAQSLKEKFEKGELVSNEESKLREEDELIFSEAKTAQSARNLFKELDSSTPKVTPRQATPRQPLKRWSSEIKQPVLPYDPENVVRASDEVDDVHVETENIANKFKFFETFKVPEKERTQFRITPPREGQVREPSPEPEETLFRSNESKQDIINVDNTRSIRNKFRMMEKEAKVEKVPEGLKPLKRFTPPPGYSNEPDESEEDSEDYDSEEDYSDDEDMYRSRIPDEELFALRQERASSLKAKFEQWETQEINHNQVDLLSEEVPSTDTAKNLRQKFEAMRLEAEKPKERLRPTVNRFKGDFGVIQDTCHYCEKRVYPLEKLELEKKIFHKNCFRCCQCNTVLRMDTYTINSGELYCMPHFKQTFLSKGNYDTPSSHRKKITTTVSNTPISNNNNNISDSD